MQSLVSAQLGGAPPTHTPPEQTSLTVQALPSSHGPERLTYSQPVAGLHASPVQTFPSSQFSDEPLTQTPPAQVSPDVQALPSLHGNELLLFWHELAMH